MADIATEDLEKIVRSDWPPRVELHSIMSKLPEPPSHPIMVMSELVQLNADLEEFEAKLADRHRELADTAKRCMDLLRIIRAARTLSESGG